MYDTYSPEVPFGFSGISSSTRFEPIIAKGIDQNEVPKNPRHAMFVYPR